jgi:hypothetical protein
MSYSSPQYYPAVEGVRQAEPKVRSAAAISRHLQRTHNGYTLAHGGHQIRIGPVAFWIVVGALVIMAVWSIATGTYFAFRDNVLTRLIGRQPKCNSRMIRAAALPRPHGARANRPVPLDADGGARAKARRRRN